MNGIPYTDEEDEYIKMNWQKIKKVEIGKHLKRSKNSLEVHARDVLHLPYYKSGDVRPESKRERMRRIAATDSLSTEEYAAIACNCKNSLTYEKE